MWDNAKIKATTRCNAAHAGSGEETTVCNYKILTKILANSLKHILPEAISGEQNCSIPQRTILNDLFLARDLIKYTKEKNNNFYLLQIDQEKAFNELDITFLFKTIEKLGIYQKFVNFIRILYKSNTSIIISNGYLSLQVTLFRDLRKRMPSFPPFVGHTRRSNNLKH